MNNKEIGNFIGKKIDDYKIIDKNRVNNRMKYNVKCLTCGVEKWIFNPKNLLHGSYCEGKKRKTGSKLIGETYGDYIVVSKNVKNNRSSYTVKCKICNSVKDIYNLYKIEHGCNCPNFNDFILGDIHGDFIIKKAYTEDRTYVDLECLVCGCKRFHVAYKDVIGTFTNQHSAICTIKNTEKFKNKKLVSKLLKTYQNINTRIRKEDTYKDVRNKFIDSVDFTTYVYEMFNKRHELENIALNKLSIDRINPYGDYEKGNVRCLTLSEQQYNKRIHHVKSVETIENSGCAE